MSVVVVDVFVVCRTVLVLRNFAFLLNHGVLSDVVRRSRDVLHNIYLLAALK
mgnify:CR=1 FL=1